MINSLKKGLMVMETFTREQPRLKLMEVAHKTGLPKATAYRFLRTLIDLEYVHYDPVAAEYYLGPRVMALGFTVISSLDLREVALPYLAELSRITDQTVNLGILDGADIVYVERVEKRRALNVDLFVGSRLNAYGTSIGRAILAFLEEDELEKSIEIMRKDPAAVKYLGHNGHKLKSELARVRHMGFALSDEQMFMGIQAAGAPILNAQGKVEAAVNLALFGQPVSRRELVEKYVPHLLKTTREISKARGYMKA